MSDSTSVTVKAGTDEAFLWTYDVASTKAFDQNGASNCGATALLNVLSALEVPLPSTSAADRAVHTNLRKYGVSTSEYLAARSVAGCTGENIVKGCETVAGDVVESRFFAFDPPREVDLQKWLCDWLSRGCGAVATLNTQQMYGADYWHHQMIFGVDNKGVHVTNGIEVLDYKEIMLGLESPSVLRIRKNDALNCKPFDPENCNSLGSRWAELKVSEQLKALKEGSSVENFVYIPAAYRAGITIFARKGSPELEVLMRAEELPLKK
eukprot:TRINITY_DN5000_c0_g1_i1.p1 TRINITY_DN5000_c0_g1~~TRINITY_DN5000_c0_g1_i1.p1  ORF type:complete len:266 (+),score=59.30 TRINITY_DN5000_c0_g1_i1:78-875(+)